jgi:hypothetical protein
MELVWQRHEIKILHNELNIKNHIQISANGLDTNAQSLHRDFITNLPHLSEVRNDHMVIVADIGSDIENLKNTNRSLISTEDLLNEFNGEMNERGISLPINSFNKSSVDIRLLFVFFKFSISEPISATITIWSFLTSDR